MEQAPKEGWITYGLMVFGALGTFVAIGGWLTQDLVLLLAFVAGGGWLLSIPLLVMGRRNARDLEKKNTEIEDLRLQLSEWRTVAIQDSDTLNRLAARAIEMPRVQPRRRQPEDQPELDDEDDQA
ncbi:hypothetical protein ACFOW6_15690 [Fodinicurvata halophila]|uniref:Uncharacterized protein n=1 Tax=Fodinicurvata halophila TaxID=1419723 RepID=A0ABV8UR98_9PROT